MESAQQSMKGIPKHILLNSSPRVLSHVLVWVIPLFLCASLFFFCPIGTHHYCLYCPPLTPSSLLAFHSFTVLLYQESSVRSFSSCLCRALCSSCPLYPHCGRGAEKRCTWEAHLGYSCVAAIGVYTWADGCQCVFSNADLCVSVCVGVCICRTAIWGIRSHLGFS